MNGLSEFDGDAERARQICDLRIRGKSEPEVCQMLGVTVEGTTASVLAKPWFACDVGLHTILQTVPSILSRVPRAMKSRAWELAGRAGAYSPSPSLPDVRT
jgi:hypothetical protein